MEGKSVPRTVRLAGQLESQTFTTVASGGLGGSRPPDPPVAYVSYSSPFESHQVGGPTTPVASEDAANSHRICTPTRTDVRYRGLRRLGGTAPQTPDVACARPSISLPRVQCSVGGQRIHEALLRSLTDIGQEVGLPHLGGTLAAFATCVTRDTLPERECALLTRAFQRSAGDRSPTSKPAVLENRRDHPTALNMVRTTAKIPGSFWAFRPEGASRWVASGSGSFVTVLQLLACPALRECQVY